MNIPPEGLANFAPGSALGTTAWVDLPQPMLTSFESLTRSNDPLHTDPGWVRSHTEYPDTIAPGLLTLSLLPHFVNQLNLAPPGHHALNYGFDRIRWLQAVPVNSRVRARFVSAGCEPRAGKPGLVLSMDVTVEIDRIDRPALVARWLGLLVPDRGTAA